MPVSTTSVHREEAVWDSARRQQCIRKTGKKVSPETTTQSVASEQWDFQTPELKENTFLLFYPENKKTLKDTQSSAVPGVEFRNAG